jgi:UDP-N-acetylglucosamine acyltransferase
VVGLRRRGFAKADIHRLRTAYQELFLGEGVFRDRLAQVEKAFAGVPLIESVFAFIRGGKRPLSTAIRRGSDGATQDD